MTLDFRSCFFYFHSKILSILKSSEVLLKKVKGTMNLTQDYKHIIRFYTEVAPKPIKANNFRTII